MHVRVRLRNQKGSSPRMVRSGEEMKSTGHSAVGLRLFGGCDLSKTLKAAAFASVIAVICGLMSLPAVFFYHSKYSDSHKVELVSCDTPMEYTEDSCRSFLNRASIELSSAEVINISSSVNQHEAENLIKGIPSLKPAPQCQAMLIPFMCRYLFMPCNNGSDVSSPSSHECVLLRDSVCTRVWKEAVEFLGVNQMPDCESLPAQDPSLEKLENFSYSSGQTNSTNTLSPLNCSEGFIFIEEVALCRPHCPSWKGYEEGIDTTYDSVVITKASMSALLCVIALLISCIRHKRLFTFPTVLLVYQTCTFLLLELETLMKFIDREAFFCSSSDWIEVLFHNSSTPFCTFDGLFLFYTLWQLILWWLFHISAVFCEIRFPLKTRSFKASGRIKYVHIGLVLAGTLFPVIPVTATAFVGGFLNTRFPPLHCHLENANAVFYITILPLSVLVTLGISLMVVIVWTIRKNSVYVGESKGVKRKATVKLVILFCYFTVLAVADLSAYIVSIQSTPMYIQDLKSYFFCESNGLGTNETNCHRGFQQYDNTALTYVGFALFGLYPASVLVYAVNFTELREKLNQCFNFNLKSKLTILSSLKNQTAADGIHTHIGQDTEVPLTDYN